MKLVGFAIKKLVMQSELTQYIETRFYNGLAPQGADYPFAIGRVTGIEPIGESKASPGLSGKACTEIYYYQVQVFDEDAETCARIASKVRKVLDHPRPGPHMGIQLNFLTFMGAEEDPYMADDAERYVWKLDFKIRVDFSTDEL